MPASSLPRRRVGRSDYRRGDVAEFYAVNTVVLVLGALVVMSGVDLIKLGAAIHDMNALLLPLVPGFLYLLAIRALPAPYRLSRGYAVLVGIILALTSGFSVYAGPARVFT